MKNYIILFFLFCLLTGCLNFNSENSQNGQFNRSVDAKLFVAYSNQNERNYDLEKKFDEAIIMEVPENI